MKGAPAGIARILAWFRGAPEMLAHLKSCNECRALSADGTGAFCVVAGNLFLAAPWLDRPEPISSANLAAFGAHVRACERCQQGPGSMCPEGRRIGGV